MRTVGAVLVSVVSCFAAPGPCGIASTYDTWTVASLDLRNPTGFLTLGASSALLKRGLKLKAGGPFSSAAFNGDTVGLAATLRAEFASGPQPVKFAYASGQILDCDPQEHTLRVEYSVFNSVVSLPSPTIEEQAAEVSRPATTGATRASNPGLAVTPLLGFNQTRRIAPGLNFAETLGPVTIEGQSQISANSRNGNLDLTGHLGTRHLWNTADLTAAAEYVDSPAGAATFKEGKVVGRFSARTKESAARHVIFRYGGALEAGHQQSSGVTPNSGYGALKLYAGVTGRPATGAFSVSYGLQIGETLHNGTPVFTKHLFDAGYNWNWNFRAAPSDDRKFRSPLAIGVHRVLTLETRLTAGLIQNPAGAPLAERFFGGNQLRPFVTDISWMVPQDAFIRSIPENKLAAVATNSLGGSRFYSANATISFTGWGKPMLPPDLATDKPTPGNPGFVAVLNGQFDGAVKALANTYRTSDPEFAKESAAVLEKTAALGKKLTAFSDLLDTISPLVASQPAVKKPKSEITIQLFSAKAATGILSRGPNPQILSQLVTRLIPAMLGHTRELKVALDSTSEATLGSQIDSDMASIAASAAEIRDDAASLPSAIYETRAWATLAPAHRALDVFLNQLNIYSIAPVAIVDVARVWPVNQGTHYALGPGLRLSLVNANFTFGYALNPRRSPAEKAGAIFFKLDLTSLF